jgi:hypothetical protein
LECFVALVAGGALTPWAALKQLLGGVGEEHAFLAAFIFGYTLPFAVGTLVFALLAFRGAFRELSGAGVAVAGAATLFLSGLLSAYLGLGRLPDYSSAEGAHPLLWILDGYFKSYGLGLMVASAALGVAAAITIDRLLERANQSAAGQQTVAG